MKSSGRWSIEPAAERIPQQPPLGGTIRFGTHGRGKWVWFAQRPGLTVYQTQMELGDIADLLEFPAAEQALLLDLRRRNARASRLAID